MRYDSFGNLLEQRGDAVRLPLGFAGGLCDADTGRFTSLDPLREKGGDTDFSSYCVDDPVNRADVGGACDDG
jgi:hypothetical protein